MNPISESWKPVLGYEEYYEVSCEGNIRSREQKACAKTNWRNIKIRYLSSKRPSKGYRGVLLRNGIDKVKRRSVHRIVAQAFIPNPNNLPQINHLNGDKNDNRVENLEWCTASQNMFHCYKTKLRTPDVGVGEKHPSARLSNEQIVEIRLMRGRNVNDVSSFFGVTNRHIHLIWARKTRILECSPKL